MSQKSCLLITFGKKGTQKYTLALALGSEKFAFPTPGEFLTWKQLTPAIPISKSLDQNGQGDWDQVTIEEVAEKGTRLSQKYSVRVVTSGGVQSGKPSDGSRKALITLDGSVRMWLSWNGDNMIDGVGFAAEGQTGGSFADFDMGPDYARISNAVSEPESSRLLSRGPLDIGSYADSRGKHGQAPAKNQDRVKITQQNNYYYNTPNAAPPANQLEALIALSRLRHNATHTDTAKALADYENHFKSDQNLTNAVTFAVEPLVQPFQQSGCSWGHKDIAAENIVDKYGAELVVQFEENHHRVPPTWNYIDAGIFARFVKKSANYFLSSDVIRSPAVRSKLLGDNSEAAYMFETRDANGKPIPGKTAVIGHEQLHKVLGVQPEHMMDSGSFFDSAKAWVQKKYGEAKDWYHRKTGKTDDKSKSDTSKKGSSKDDEDEDVQPSKARSTRMLSSGSCNLQATRYAYAGEDKKIDVRVVPEQPKPQTNSSQPNNTNADKAAEAPSGAATPIEMAHANGFFGGLAKSIMNNIKAPSDPLKGKNLSLQDVQDYEKLLLEAYAASPTKKDFEEWCHEQPVDKLYKVNVWMRHLISLYYSMNLSKYETRFTVEELSKRINTANKRLYPQ